jgi:hypothetical protein
MQAVLARLYTDRDFRDRFFDDPNVVCSGYPLTPAEATNLSRIDRSQVERFARALVKKREEQVRELIPAAAVALQSSFSTRFAGFCDQQPSTSEPIGPDSC